LDAFLLEVVALLGGKLVAVATRLGPLGPPLMVD